MIFFRKMLFPFAILYGWITQLRNFLFDKGFLKSYSFDLPIIAVGNLSVGGTGKTPQIEYLIRLLSQHYSIATLSRGYKRQTTGYILADASATAGSLGDEPFQFYHKFPNIQVAVDEDRKNGIEQLLKAQKPDVILLDDAFQHRKVKAGLYILLTAYDDLFCDDYILPAGNLRESRSGAKRADMIIVTKCPKNISVIVQQEIISRIGTDKPIYFSAIQYDNNVYSESISIPVTEIKITDKLLLAGIANPLSFYKYLKNQNDIFKTFPDHHHFSEQEILNLKKQASNKLIVTTEKDYVRLKERFTVEQLFYLPIKTSFVSNADNFNKTILNYVGKSTANRYLY